MLFSGAKKESDDFLLVLEFLSLAALSGEAGDSAVVDIDFRVIKVNPGIPPPMYETHEPAQRSSPTPSGKHTFV
jgi:hypothetical protein